MSDPTDPEMEGRDRSRYIKTTTVCIVPGVTHFLLVCRACGAAVADCALHDRFHDRLTSVSMRGMRIG